MHLCIDTFTHSNQGVKSEEGQMEHMVPYRGTYVCVQLCKRDGADVRSQMGMHTCSDTSTHSTKGLAPEEMWLVHACWPKQGYTYLYITRKWGGTDMGSQDMYTCTDACTHSHQGVGPGEDDWDMYWGPQRDACVHTQECKWDGAHMEASCTVMHILMHVHIITKEWNLRRGLGHTRPHRDAYFYAQLYKGADGKSGGHIHVLMHAHSN